MITCAAPRCQRIPLPRQTTVDETRLIGFGKWLLPHLKRRGWTLNRLADAVGMDAGHLGKIVKSYEPRYSSYTRPGYDNTVAIGRLFNDVRGALENAGFEDLSEPSDEITYIPNPAERTLLERYSNSDEAGRRLIDETAEMAAERAALRASRAGAIGGRAGDGD